MKIEGLLLPFDDPSIDGDPKGSDAAYPLHIAVTSRKRFRHSF
ncbi:hypothetical protein [Streptomyces sp. NPDC001652]